MKISKIVGTAVLFFLAARLAQAQDLAASVAVTVQSNTWSYALSNNDSLSSSNFITDFSLSVDAPITSVTAPSGWSFRTDGSSFVYWFNTDGQMPYFHDIAPQSSLGGFSFSSSATERQLSDFGISAWDHSTDAPGTAASGSVLAPSTPAPVPEFGTWQSLGALLLLGGLFVARRTHPKPG